MSPVPFFAQEHAESCVPACLRIVLASFGTLRTEAELYECCRTDIDGTFPSIAVQCAEGFGFTASAARLRDVSALLHQIDEGYTHPIVFINLSPLMGLNVLHAVVIDTIDTNSATIQAIDPAYPPTGQRVWPQTLFVKGWQMARGQTILVRS
ncbi:MAG: hypothetical protein DWI57_05665 [Chloroflexi bacterium]|nr:MAG: hypothetical protein DWI57_05665 [Chloroflexota bacterium]